MQRTKNIVCFHGSFTNNNIMIKQLKHIISNHKVTSYDQNFNHKKYNLDITKDQYNITSNHFHIPNGPFEKNQHLNVINKIFNSDEKNTYSWINNFNVNYDNTYKLTDLNYSINKYKLTDFNYSINNYSMEKNEILYKLNKLQEKINFDCAISFSSGVYPAIQMLQNKIIKNAIIICPTVSDYDIYTHIKDSNILFIVGKQDGIYEKSKYMFNKLKNSNNCELIEIDRGHIIPNLNKNCDDSKLAIDKINKFIDDIDTYLYDDHTVVS